MPLPSAWHSLVTFDHQLVLFGGYNEQGDVRWVYERTPLEENAKWKELKLMHWCGVEFAGITLDEEVYAIGRSDNCTVEHSNVQIFNGEYRRWPRLSLYNLYAALCCYPSIPG